jgi:DnaJ-domain-containing protein 1
MSRTTRNSSGSSGSNEVQEDDHNAIAGSTPDLAERVAQQEALNAIAEANAHLDGIIDPAAKRLALIAKVNASNLASEKARKIAKGLLILQSKEPPFEVEDMLKKNDIMQFKLT